jgi:hypothetical protein
MPSVASDTTFNSDMSYHGVIGLSTSVISLGLELLDSAFVGLLVLIIVLDLVVELDLVIGLFPPSFHLTGPLRAKWSFIRAANSFAISARPVLAGATTFWSCR